MRRGGTFVLAALWLPLAAFAGDVLSIDEVGPAPTVGDATTREAIVRLGAILDRAAADADLTAEMRFRLAELYLAEARALALSDPDRGEALAAPSREEAVQLLAVLLAEHPRWARADEAALALGVEQAALGRSSDALHTFTDLVRTWPGSPHATDAYLRIGEHWFDAGEPFRALVAYEKVRSSSDLYPFARYKLAWCLYNVGEVDRAIATMQEVVHLGPTGRLRLDDEANRDLVRFFADVGDVAAAHAWFAGRGDEVGYLAAMGGVAARLYDNGAWEASIAAYEHVLAVAPTDARAAEWQLAVVRAARRTNDADRVLAEIDTLLAGYGRASAWARAHAAERETLAAADDAIEGELRAATIAWHKRSLGVSAAEAVELRTAAYAGYQRYVAAFGEDANAAEMQYSFGELLWKLGRYEEAYDAYRAVVRADPAGPRAAFSAESAVFAADEIRKGEPEPGPPPRALTGGEQRFVDAVDEYAERFGGPKALPMLYSAALLLDRAGATAEAARRYDQLIATDPGSASATDAARRIVDQLARAGDWAAVGEYAGRYAALDGLGDAPFRAEMAEIAERAAFAEVEATFVRDADSGRAGDGFAAFAGRYPRSPLAAQALHNASVHYRAAGRLADEIAARTTLVDDVRFGPRTKYYVDALIALGYAEEQTADFAEAARRYEQAVATGASHAAMADAAYSAGALRAALAEWQEAIAGYRLFLERFPADPRADDVRVAIGRLYDAHEQPADAMEAYRSVRAPDASLAAEIAFRDLEPAFAAYDTMAIGLHGAKSKDAQDAALRGDVAAKTEALVALVETYKVILDSAPAEWGLACVVRIGQATEDLGDALLASEVPTYLDADQREIYVAMLRDRAAEQHHAAVTVYELALARSRELSIYTPYTELAFARLAVLDPERHQAIDEALPQPALAPTAPPSSFETDIEVPADDAAPHRRRDRRRHRP